MKTERTSATTPPERSLKKLYAKAGRKPLPHRNRYLADVLAVAEIDEDRGVYRLSDEDFARIAAEWATIDAQIKAAKKAARGKADRPHGPGDALHDIFAKLGVKPSSECACNKHIATMNTWGWQKCINNIDEIVGWVRAESMKMPGGGIAPVLIREVVVAALGGMKIIPAPHDGPIRAAFICRTLEYGGVEGWMEQLAKATDRSRVEWRVGMAARAKFTHEIKARLDRYVPVVVGERESAALCEWADIVVIWGLEDPDAVVGTFGGPIVSVAHGCCEWTKRFVDRAARLATHNAGVSELACSMFGGKPSVTILNGIDAEKLKPGRDRATVRREWGVGDDELVVGYIGRMERNKRPELAIEAVRELGPGHRAVLVGRTYDPAFVEEMKASDPRAVFAPWTDAVGEALRAMDCMVSLGDSEGNPLVITEAMYCGTACVMTDTGMAPELKRLGDPIEIVPVDPSPGVVAAAIKRAMLRDREPARRLAEERFTSEGMARQWEDYLIDVVERVGAAPVDGG